MDWTDNNFGNNSGNNIGNDDKLFYLASKETSLEDPNYRYKISSPIITTTGKKGNRITWFENSEYFSENMGGCPSIFFGKYIGNKISCPTYFDKDKNCIAWKGEYSKELIFNYLMNYVKIYSLCDICDFPETLLYLDEKKCIYKLCKSCGGSFLIPSKYMDKTYDYISKNITQKA